MANLTTNSLCKVGSSHPGSPLPGLVLYASAGTGKTHRLAIRYLQLVFQGTPVAKILATTFTRKAAGEIFDRVIQRIVEALQSDSARKQLKDDLQLISLSRADCLNELVRLTRQIHRLRISTLDSFFSQMARSFSLELGLPPNWQIGDAATDVALRRRSIRQMLTSTKDSEITNLVHLLNHDHADRQIGEKMLSAVNECYDIYRAAPQSAWTTIRRTSRLSEEELADAMQKMSEAPLPRHKKIRDAHQNACKHVLNDDWEAFLETGIAPKIIDGKNQYYQQELPPDLIACYRPLIEHTTAYVRERIANRTEGTFRTADRFELFYLLQKYGEGLFQFDDITCRLAEMINSMQNNHIAYRLDGTIDHLLLDEFQDTSLIQWRVLRPLAQWVTNQQPVSTSFFCVGDSKQAIYAWRGGRCEIFDGLIQTLEGLQKKTMSESFRSAPPIIDAVNNVFKNVTLHPKLCKEPAVQRWRDDFPLHTTARVTLPGYVEGCTSSLNEHGKQDDSLTLQRAAKKIAELVAQFPSMSIGVLTRERASATKLIFELGRENIKASQEGGRQLTNSASVRLILSLMTLGDHPGNTVAQFHLSTSPLAAVLGLKENTIDGESAWKVSRNIRRDLLEKGYGPTVQYWMEQLVPYCSAWERRRLNRLVDLAYVYDTRTTLRGDDFVSFIEHENVDDPTMANVTVMTIHASKGLQFHIVVLPELDSLHAFGTHVNFVTGFDQQCLAHNPVCRYPKRAYRKLLPQKIQETVQQEIDRHVQEGICRLYVAMTRAIHGLYLILAPPLPKEKSLPKSYAGLLRATLLHDTKLQPLQDYPLFGKKDWYTESLCKNSSTKSDASITQLELAPLPTPKKAISRDAAMIAPSQIAGKPQVVLAERLQLESQSVYQYGSLIHGWLELIQWLDEGQPTDEQLLEVAQALDIQFIDVQHAKEQFHMMLRSQGTSAMLTRQGFREAAPQAWPTNLRSQMAKGQHSLEVRNEQSIAALQQGKLISGFVDRLVLLCNGDQILAADIVDYKTDQLRQGQTELIKQKANFYRPQLVAYRYAIASMLHLDFSNISTRLLFTDPGLVVEVNP